MYPIGYMYNAVELTRLMNTDQYVIRILLVHYISFGYDYYKKQLVLQLLRIINIV